MRVLIADDHDLLRDTLAHYFRQEAGIDPVVTADFDGARSIVAAEGPFDVVVLDFGMPGMNGLEGLREALGWTGARAVALMSGIAPREVAEAAYAMGAAGFLPKTMPARTLASAVRFMGSGETYTPVEFVTAGASVGGGGHPLAGRLTRREMQVLEGLCRGKANKEIARDLELMEPTVKLHVKTLCRKLGATNRTQAAMIGKEAGLF